MRLSNTLAWVSYRPFCGVSDIDVRCPIHAGPHKHKKPYTISKGRKVSTFNQFPTRSHTLLYSSSVLVVAENRAVSRCNFVSPISTWPRWAAVETIMEIMVTTHLCRILYAIATQYGAQTQLPTKSPKRFQEILYRINLVFLVACLCFS